MADPKGALSTLDETSNTDEVVETSGGPLANVAVKTSVPRQGQLATLSAKDASLLDPTSSKGILEAMQKLIEQKEAQQNSLLTALNLASAYGSGGTEGPQRQVQAQMAQHGANQNDIYNMRLQKAQLEGQQASAQSQLQNWTQPIGGAPSGAAGASSGTAGAPAGGSALSGNNQFEQFISKLPETQKIAARSLLGKGEAGMAEIRKMVSSHEANLIRSESEMQRNIRYLNTLPEGPEKEALRAQIYTEAKKPTVGVNDEGALFNIPAVSQTNARPVAPPVATTPPTVTAPPVNAAPTTNAPVISSGPGPRINPITGKEEIHQGNDIVLPANTPVKGTTHPMMAPIIGGKVSRVIPTEASGGYGNSVIVTGADGKEYRLAHFNKVNVAPGDQITPDTIIGEAGNTGKARGNHLHFEAINAPARPAVAPTKPTQPKTQSQLKIEEEKAIADQRAIAEGSAAEFKAMGKSAADEAQQTMDNWHVAETTIVNAEKIKELAQRNKSTLGVFQKAGPGVAIADALETGLKLGPLGTIGLPLERVAARLIPGSTDQAIRDRATLTSLLNEQELELARMNKGQGSWSDFERRIMSGVVGSVSNSAEFLMRRADLIKARGEFNQQLGDVWRAYKRKNPDAKYSTFQNTDAYDDTVKAYKSKLRKQFNNEYLNGKDSPASLRPETPDILNRYPGEKK